MNGIFVSPDAEETNVALVPVLQKAYQQFLKHPPSICLEKHQLSESMSVFEEIQAGTVVAEYLGEIKPGMSLSLVDNSYLFDPFDAEHKRGIGALINDGFPIHMTFEFRIRREFSTALSSALLLKSRKEVRSYIITVLDQRSNFSAITNFMIRKLIAFFKIYKSKFQFYHPRL